MKYCDHKCFAKIPPIEVDKPGFRREFGLSSVAQKDKDLFENLFVLEMANNHWGRVERGLKLIHDHGTIVRFNNIKASIKLQFRDVDEFIHQDFKGAADNRYIKKTQDTKLSKEEFSRLVEEIKNVGCIPMATPFDEASVDLCLEFDMPIIKIASSDLNDWVLIEKIASTRRPTIVSTGGASEKDLDDLVHFFDKREISLAINHCVSLYPSEDSELELDQIDYLKARYPNHVIGLSTHEYHDWQSSMFISYGKGARTWERHVDIDYEGVPVSSYCSLPEQCDEWFKAFHKAAEMCGGRSGSRRSISRREVEYLDALVRGAYAKKDLEPGYVFSKESFANDFYLAIPLQKGQLSCREVMNGEKLTVPIRANEALSINHIDGPYNENSKLRNFILNRGL
jgi:N-acetylneuraminate synthase